MRKSYFEAVWTDYKKGALVSNNYDIKHLGFMYSDNEKDLFNTVMFYTDKKEDLADYLEYLLETSRKSRANVIILGYIIKKGAKYIVTINREDLYYIDVDIKAKLINNIEPEYLICPEIVFYTWRQKVDLIKVSF